MMPRAILPLIFCVLVSARLSAQCLVTISTGFDQEEGLALEEGVPDEDYIVTDPFGVDAVPLTLITDGFPIGPWLANSEESLWIVPNADPDANGPPGQYVYTIEIDLDAPEPELATIVGRWATDNSGTDVIINGNPSGVRAGGFGAWTDFPADAGAGLFVDGFNTIEFIVDNAPPGDNPTGLRVEACIGSPLPQERPLNISTGFNRAANATFGDGEEDLHYTVNGPGTGGEVAATAVPAGNLPDFPPWRPNTIDSRWIGLADPNSVGPAGEYTYKTEVTIPDEIDASLVVFDAGVASDDEIVDVLVNENSIGMTAFGTENLTPFAVGAGRGLFRSGVNAIEFVVNNVGDSPTGLRVDGQLVEGPPPVEQSPNLFSIDTGFDDENGELIGNGLQDDHWVMIGPPGSGLFEFAGIVRDDQWPVAPAGPWVAPTSRARWIGTREISSNGPPGDYTFRILVELPDAVDATEARLVGRWTSDNAGREIRINGISAGAAPDGNFPVLAPMPPDLGLGLFENGVNTVEIIVNNAGDNLNPVGLFVEAAVGTGTIDPSDVSTGISGRGIGPLPAGIDDERYTVLEPDALEARPAVVVGSPDASWAPNSETSQWVGLDGEASDGIAGRYVYALDIVLPAGVNPMRASLAGEWAAASRGIDIALNGESLDVSVGGPGGLVPLPDRFGLGKFLPGLNVFEFTVEADSPTALRVEASLTSVTGPNPLDISTGFAEIAGETLGGGEEDDGYIVSDPFGIGEPAIVLADGEVPGTWAGNTNTSRWIGIVGALAASPGDYSYRTTVALDSEEQANAAFIRGVVAADDILVDVLINEQSTGFQTVSGFVAYTEFPPDFGKGLFLPGDNDIDFVVQNGGEAGNPSGLRVDAVIETGVAPPQREVCDNGIDDDNDGDTDCDDADCAGNVACPTGTPFRRGDTTQDGVLNITDAVKIFGILFLGDPDIPCAEAKDVNNDGDVNITDGIRILGFLFLGQPPPQAPGHENCGLDPDEPGSAGDLGCESDPACE